MGKKTIVASYLGRLATLGFDNVESAKCLTMIMSVLAYTLQLYFDFSGYCGRYILYAGILPASELCFSV